MGKLKLLINDDNLVSFISNPNHLPNHKYNLFCSPRSIDDGCCSKENRAIECRLLWFSTAHG